ncbi:transcription factor DIVARICATA-like [Ipomoea triloba]|uniref:transcription factor DIVARICATA-like n=1 Tax=Ipomoea triloba TaxID=35885 RepID=UPI00125E6001|nr:transcription factor DIVARICATA-like [Ipomoea triloba]
MSQEMGILSSETYLSDSNWLFDEAKASKWTAEENKRFEDALALFDKDTPDRWHNVAAMIPGKTVNDVIRQYRELVADVSDIEAGLIPIPGYATSHSFTLEWVDSHSHGGYDAYRQFYAPPGKRSNSSRSSDHERKKGVPWTEEEHRQFLLGLKKYGKGDWRNISRNFVTSRTPTQVASHAQKYFIRQLSGGKDKRRSSIHDITTVNLSETKSPSPENNINSCSSDKPAAQVITTPPPLSNNHGGVSITFDSQYGSLITATAATFQGTSSYGLNLHEHNNMQYNNNNINLHGLQFQMQPE